MPIPHPVTIRLNPEKRREALRQDALRAWSIFQDTGLHVTGDGADAWLAQLEAGQDVAPPDGHP